MADSSEPTERHFGVTQASIQFRGQSRAMYFHGKTNDGLLIAQNIASGKSYPHVDFITNVRTILDVGANIGASVLYFAATYPEARVLAFEPYRESYDLMVRNVQDLPNIACFDYGLYDQDQRAALHLGLNDSVTNSIRASLMTSEGESVEVNLRNANTVLVEQRITHIDILKLDTEGCELPILRSLANVIPNIGVLYVEFHSEADRFELDRLLTPTHMLYLGSILSPHRGDLCYVLRRHIPPRSHALQIPNPLATTS